jgi:hypothetical protein
MDSAQDIDISSINTSPNGFHCARKVLEEIRKQTSVGNLTLEKISIALDGGIGLQGQACGAICGAIMGMSLQSGENYIEHGMIKNTRSLLKSVKAIRKNKNNSKFRLFSEGKNFIEDFLKKAGSMECRDIVNNYFESWNEFQKFGHSSEKGKSLINFSIERAIEFIQNSNS